MNNCTYDNGIFKYPITAEQMQGDYISIYVTDGTCIDLFQYDEEDKLMAIETIKAQPYF